MLATVTDWLWSYVLIVALLAVGIRLTVTARFVQIRLFKDMDSHNASTAPSIGSSFGVNDDVPADNTDANEAMTPEDVLLYIAMGAGGAAVLLLGLLILRRPENSDISESE